MKRIELVNEPPCYYVVMADCGNYREAVVDPEMTRRGAVWEIRQRLKDNCPIEFVHHIHDGVCEDVTDELVEEANRSILEDARAA